MTSRWLSLVIYLSTFMNRHTYTHHQQKQLAAGAHQAPPPTTTPVVPIIHQTRALPILQSRTKASHYSCSTTKASRKHAGCIIVPAWHPQTSVLSIDGLEHTRNRQDCHEAVREAVALSNVSPRVYEYRHDDLLFTRFARQAFGPAEAHPRRSYNREE